MKVTVSENEEVDVQDVDSEFRRDYVRTKLGYLIIWGFVSLGSGAYLYDMATHPIPKLKSIQDVSKGTEALPELLGSFTFQVVVVALLLAVGVYAAHKQYRDILQFVEEVKGDEDV